MGSKKNKRFGGRHRPKKRKYWGSPGRKSTLEDDSKSAESSADKSKSTYVSASAKKESGLPSWIFSESQSSSEDDESISSCEETWYPDTLAPAMMIMMGRRKVGFSFFRVPEIELLTW